MRVTPFRSLSCAALTAAALVWATGAPAQFVEPDVEVLASHLAEVPGDGLGFVAESIGDINRDGASEYIIGAPFSGEGGMNAGKAYVYDGRTGAVLKTWVGNPFDRLGLAVGAVGDVNKDGRPDYCIGAPGSFGQPDPNPGRVLVVSGKNHKLIHELTGDPQSLFGYECNGGADVDGDKRADILVGAILGNGFTGKLHMFSGKTGESLWTLDGQDPSGLLGSAVSEALGDLNHDGVADYSVGSFQGGPNQTGVAFIVSGVDGAVLDTLEPDPVNAGQFGWFFSHNADDVNNDGFDDIYISDFSDGTVGPFSGRGYVFSGADSSTLLTFEGEAAGDGLGMGRGAGDLDCDEHDDLIVGAYLHSGAAPQGGKAYLHSGRDGSLFREFTSDVAGAQIGFDVVTLGDVNGDGNTDFLLTGIDVAHVVAGIPSGDQDAPCDGDDDDDDDHRPRTPRRR